MILNELTPRDVVTVAPEETIREAAKKMEDENIGAVVVVSDGKVAGILTDRDVAVAVVVDGVPPDSPVEQIMTKDVKTIWEDEGVFNATQYFLSHKIRRLPVINHRDELVGLVTTDDLFALLSRELFNVAKALEPALPEHV